MRVPIGNSRSMRVEVRSVAPDANPCLTLYSIFQDGDRWNQIRHRRLAPGAAVPADHIQQAIEDFKSSSWIGKILGSDVQGRFVELKQGRPTTRRAGLGTLCSEGFRGAVSPRGLQPIALEPVLSSEQAYLQRATDPWGKSERRTLRGAPFFSCIAVARQLGKLGSPWAGSTLRPRASEPSYRSIGFCPSYRADTAGLIDEIARKAAAEFLPKGFHESR